MTTDHPEPPDETPPEAETAPEPEVEVEESPEEIRCAICDSRLEPDQTYCLECGTPTQVAPQLRRGGRAAWIVGLGLVLAGIGAGALAYAMSDDESPRRGAATGTSSDLATGSLPIDTTSIGTEFPSVSLSTDTTLTEAPVTDITETTATAAFISDWPSGTTAYTAILSSVRELAEAQATAERARGTGESAGVLFSTDHAGLSPGFYVVYSGVFDTRAEAVAHARKLAANFSGANARQIVG